MSSDTFAGLVGLVIIILMIVVAANDDTNYGDPVLSDEMEKKEDYCRSLGSRGGLSVDVESVNTCLEQIGYYEAVAEKLGDIK